jgi:molybdopterin-guanine dinucleotide biosynthesis protein A
VDQVDKAWLEIEGVPIIDRVASATRPVVDRLGIIVSAANSQLERYRELAESWDAKLIFDLHEHRGPLGGIHTALTHCAVEEAALILACDLPFITTALLSFLSEIHARSNPQSVTVPLDSSNRLQPLAAIYNQSLATTVEQMLAANELKVDRLYSRVLTRQVGFSEFAHLAGAAHFFTNLNTPEEYSTALKLARPQ